MTALTLVAYQIINLALLHITHLVAFKHQSIPKCKSRSPDLELSPSEKSLLPYPNQKAEHIYLPKMSLKMPKGGQMQLFKDGYKVSCSSPLDNILVHHLRYEIINN